MISSAVPCSAQRRALVSSGKALMSLSSSIFLFGKISRTTSGRHVLTERIGGQICAESFGCRSLHEFSQRSRNPPKRLTSSSTVTAARFVRALSAPTSITSAPLRICSRACSMAASKSSVPSPENESSFTFTIPMISGRRGNGITRSGRRRRMRACSRGKSKTEP